MIISCDEIRNLNHVKELLDEIKLHLKYQDEMQDIPEEMLEEFNAQLCEIDDFIIENQQVNSINEFHAVMRMFHYWEYIEGEMDFYTMIGELKENEGEV